MAWDLAKPIVVAEAWPKEGGGIEISIKLDPEFVCFMSGHVWNKYNAEGEYKVNWNCKRCSKRRKGR
jgi:hypothetical protein